MQRWRSQLRAWGNNYASKLVKREGVLGVMIGGSLARGQEWQHSDLELGILLEKTDRDLPYFNIDAGRGVEIIQLLRDELTEQINLAESGDWTPVVKWHIQLWKGRIISDPTGLLGRFKRVFDNELFQDQVIDGRLANLSTEIHRVLDEARALLRMGRPAAALAKLRFAMNDTILAFHWVHKELPRSQNRTDSRLHHICRKYSTLSFYSLYRDVFDLDSTNRVIQKCWPNVRENILELTRLWGESAREFFNYAVDSHFEWRQNAGILTVYRLYLPMMGEGEQGIFGKLDNKEWATQNKLIMEFLGLTDIDTETISALIDRVANVSLS